MDGELRAIRHDLHAYPEIGFEENRTSARIAELLVSWGIEVHQGIGGTGVVGVVEGVRGQGSRIGLRADMDALPMQEMTDLPFRSTIAGRFHGCGHDGHTTMLLGAGRHLAANRDFAGRVVLIFQPAEEGLGGARAMLADGLFDRFPLDEIYALHNAPWLKPGELSVFDGPAMAAADLFDIRIRGIGAHAAMPHLARDPVVAAAALVQALQTIPARNVDPFEAAVISVTALNAGEAYNVLPDEALLRGTLRAFSQDVMKLMRKRIAAVVEGVAASHDVAIELDLRPAFDVLVNHAGPTAALAGAALDIVGEAGVLTDRRPIMASEDFADMLRVVPGCYAWLGHGGDVPLHHPGFVLDDDILTVGASLFARIALNRLVAGAAGRAN
ncbi:amidohydrolase [Ancylobacter sonchi]|nr:amidohydrolase [Ancylobacter sonchi]MBS7533225.1 amidohydrolase [Ancylobacter sonchi]